MKIELLSMALSGGYFAAMTIPVALALGLRRPAALLPRALLLVFGSAAAMSLTIVCLWWLLDEALIDHLHSLDLDSDGSWSEFEENTWSDRQRRYYDMAFDDGARNLFAIYVYPVFSLIWSALIVGGILFYQRFRELNR